MASFFFNLKPTFFKLHAQDHALNEPFLCMPNQVAPKSARTNEVQIQKMLISWGMHVA
jgi:hypothetical protein